MAQYQVGILGGGQLARMSIIAAHQLGVKAVSLDPDSNSPAAQVGPFIVGSITNPDDIAKVMRCCEFVTFENEFIPAEAMRQACRQATFSPERVTPSIETLEVIQDKLTQRRTLLAQGVPSPRALSAADARELGFPCVLKSRFGGYDGKGTRYARDEAEYESILEQIEVEQWLAEEFVPFKRELAVMVCAGDEMSCFPTMVTEQKNHVCDLVYNVEDEITQERGAQVAMAAVAALNAKGLYGVELFELEDGTISVNEIAPRPHNSGHYTLDWGAMSQFEAHILLTMGAFGTAHWGDKTCMANILGQSNSGDYLKALSEMTISHPEARMHWYGKAEAKPGRKMGHINVCAPAVSVEWARQARETFYRSWGTK
ncbi:MAG: ATP-grasp domain-containing protein [Armatimonadota bacterium]